MQTKIHKQKLLEEIQDKYSEWLETAGDKAPVILVGILAQMLHEERETSKYYKTLWNNCNGKDTPPKYTRRQSL